MNKGNETKSIPITKKMVWEAYKKVKANRGSAGIDRVNLESYEKSLKKNLYKIWNRLTSGSYFPLPVREVLIPKGDGKQRKLGIPTVGDRIAQQVIKTYLEPRMEKEFHNNSYGYRPFKSAHQALEQVRQNVRQYAWVIDMDIKSFFDEVSHDLLMNMLDDHVAEKWIKMYVKRWLESPVETKTGDLITKEGKGTPQGGVISPLLANLYLHYALDKWLEQNYPTIKFVRYADDVIIHCHSEEEAKIILESVKERMEAYKLQLHEQKTKIVYCQDYRRAKKNFQKKFDFLGFSFQPVSIKSKRGGVFLGYTCKMSIRSKKRVNQTIKQTQFHRWTNATIEDISNLLDPKIRGWVSYYGKLSRNELARVFRLFHHRLMKWVLNKYKSLRNSKGKAYRYLKEIRKTKPELFYHWKQGYSI